ncbi:MAG: ATP-dependent helicase UvrD/PcrA [Frankiales bacterium]|nr:ATP-dependent helicase UvrD/PcrA [Frankiales bacterium]
MDRQQLCDALQVPFTDEQLAAITAPLAPGLIVAGAGSGKTTVMAARVVWLVANDLVAPEEVLGLTFTNKAAAELASRISRSLAAAGISVRGDDRGEPVVSTYHAFAGRLVTEHGLRLGVEPRSRLLADATRFQLAARVLRRHRGPVVALTRPLSMLVGDLVSLDSEMSEHLVEPDELLAWEADWVRQLEEAAASFDGVRGTKTHTDTLARWINVSRQRTELGQLVAAYREAKRDLDAVDFGDQVSLGARLAEQVPEVGALERTTARVVLLDEYQDTSVAQRRMLVGLFGGGHPVTAVGDPCQAIYGWRGASVANLDEFPEHFRSIAGEPAGVYSLSVNQRSGGRLLTLANRVAEALRAKHHVVELRAPEAKAALGDVRVALHPCWSDELGWVADQVEAARAAGTPWREIAVLVRARRDFGDLHATLVARGIPVEVVGLGGLLQLPEVADVVATLEVVEEPTANAALLRLLTGPRWRLGVRDLAHLGRRGKELLRSGVLDPRLDEEDPPEVDETDLDVDDTALEEAVAGIDPCDVVSLSDVLDRPGHKGWSLDGLHRVTALGSELRELRRHRDEPLLDLVHRVIETSGLDVELAASPEAVAARRKESLSAFLDVVAGFSDLDGETSLTSFLAFLRAADEHERGLDTIAPSGSDAVQLMTAHKSKGLEWDVVVCPDLTKGVFPADVLKGRWPTTCAVLPGPLRGDVDDQPRLDVALTKESLSSYEGECREHLEREERRLGYVAFTRARALLVGSAHWWGPTQKKRRGPSAFLGELRDHAEAGHGVVDLWAEQPADDDGNPALAERPVFEWPTPYAPEALLRRRSAAEQVRTDLLALAAGTPLDEDAGLTPAERQELDRLDQEARLLLDEELEARRSVRTVTLPSSLSASQLMRLQQDPEAFARELARPMPRPPAPAARRGTRFHAWVETLFEERPLLDPDELPGAEDDELGTDEDLLALQEAFQAGPWASRKPYAVEAPFSLPLAGRVVRGRIDAVYDLGDGRWQVVDWKTGREAADPVQLAVYRLAWARLVGADPSQVSGLFLYVRTGREDLHEDLPGAEELEALLTGRIEPEHLTLL